MARVMVRLKLGAVASETPGYQVERGWNGEGGGGRKQEGSRGVASGPCCPSETSTIQPVLILKLQ